MTSNLKTPVVSVGYEPIDLDHVEFSSLIEQLERVDNVGFPTLFDQLLAHTEQHFAQENELMENSQFPALQEHKGEHVRVIGEFRQFKLRVDKGLVAFGRSFLRDRVVPWFKLHITTMDSALVSHLHGQAGEQVPKRAGAR